MPHIFDQTPNVDIYQYPEKIQTFGSNDKLELTLGDLHGNTMKMIYFLVTSGIMSIAEEDYLSLAQIYQKDYKMLTDEDVVRFKTILNKPQTRFNAGAFLRFIGNVLADRGNNDLFTLLLLQRLHDAVVPYEILFSQSDAAFIECCEASTSFYKDSIFTKASKTHSLHNLHYILQDDIPPIGKVRDSDAYNKLSVTRQNILAIIECAYKPHLQALSYTLSEDKKKITIFTHAPVGLNTIKKLSEELVGKKKYDSSTAAKLAKTIDSINHVFTEHVQSGNLTQAKQKPALYSPTKLEEFVRNTKCNTDMTTLKSIASTQQYSALIILASNSISTLLDRPKNRGKYFYHFVHGHCKYPMLSDETNILNLHNDNAIGKPNIKTSIYTALISVKHIDHLPLLISQQPDEPPLIDEVATSSIVPTIAVPIDLSQSMTVAQQKTDVISPIISFQTPDIALGLKNIQDDILNRAWITNMGGETLAGATTKVPKTIAKIYTVIENAKIDQNNQAVSPVNWLATRNLVINLCEQAISSDHFSRDPATHKWLQVVVSASPAVIALEPNVKNHTKITNTFVADILASIQQTELTGGQTISIEDKQGITYNKKVPRTFAQIYTVIQQAKKDKNGNDVNEPNWKVTREKIFTIAKTSAENITKFRSHDTQKTIVNIVNNLTPGAENFKIQFLAIKAAILDTTAKQGLDYYQVGFFFKNICSLYETKTISWKEKVILELIQQTEDDLLPSISAAEKISAIINNSTQNLNFLQNENEQLINLITAHDNNKFIALGFSI